MMQNMPAVIIVADAPYDDAAQPRSKLPTGINPWCPKAYMLITLPRVLSLTEVWTYELAEVLWSIAPSPDNATKIIENQSIFEKENKMRAAPNTEAKNTALRSSPRRSFRDAAQKAPMTAPTAVAELRKPKVSAPPPKMSFAKTGNKIVYDHPKKLIAATSRSIFFKLGFAEIYLNPSFNSSSACFSSFFLGSSAARIMKREMMTGI